MFSIILDHLVSKFIWHLCSTILMFQQCEIEVKVHTILTRSCEKGAKVEKEEKLRQSKWVI